MNCNWLFNVPFLLLLVCTGCGGGPTDYPDMGTVSGTVTMDGQPLVDARIAFQPEGNRPSYGVTDSSGYYTLTYSATKEGAKVGKHKVSISTFRDEGDPEDPQITAETVPNKYNTKSELTAMVEGGSNTFDFALTSDGEIDEYVAEDLDAN